MDKREGREEGEGREERVVEHGEEGRRSTTLAALLLPRSCGGARGRGLQLRE
jgi:hypothetical protein